MKRREFISKSSNNEKKVYLLLIGLAIISIIIGCCFILFISKDNKEFIKDNLSNYFNNNESSMSLFFKTLFNYYLYIIIIWILGISIIGIPIVIFMYLFKSFIFGFSLSSIIYSLGSKGIMISIIDLLPHKLLFLIVLLLITYYSLSFSTKLIKHLFLRKSINFKEAINKYFRVLIICLSTSIFISLYEVFVSTYLIKFFNI